MKWRQDDLKKLLTKNFSVKKCESFSLKQILYETVILNYSSFDTTISNWISINR